MTYYLVVSTAVILFIALIWSRADPINALVKLFFFGIGCYGVFVTLQYLGYILHK